MITLFIVVPITPVNERLDMILLKDEAISELYEQILRFFLNTDV